MVKKEKNDKKQKEEDEERRSAREAGYVHAKKGIGRANVRRLAKRAGVQRVSDDGVIEQFREAGVSFIYEVVKHSVTFAEYNKRITITIPDVIHALKIIGRPIYGYGF